MFVTLSNPDLPKGHSVKKNGKYKKCSSWRENPMKISTLAVLKIRPGALLGKMSK